MAKTIGVVLSERVIAGLVIDNRMEGELRSYPDNQDDESALVELHTEGLIRVICEQVTYENLVQRSFDKIRQAKSDGFADRPAALGYPCRC